MIPQAIDSFFFFSSLDDQHGLKLLCGAAFLVWTVLIALFYRHHQSRPPKPRRIGILYARYFGVNGSLFTWKVVSFQVFTVVLQTYGKLLTLGQQANSGDGISRYVYWIYFGLLVINAIVPPVLLRAKSAYWQRVVVCFVDIGLDLMYSLVFAAYLAFGIQALHLTVPSDAVGFGSNLFPLLHILSVARAIKIHKMYSLGDFANKGF